MLFRLAFLAVFVVSCAYSQTQYIDGGRTIEFGVNNLGIDSGSANSYAVAAPLGMHGYQTGATYQFIASHNNTGSATLTIGSFGAKTIYKNKNVPLASGDIVSGQFVLAAYDGTALEMISQTANAASGSSGAVTLTGDVTGSGTGSLATTLATVNTTPGSFGSSTQTPVLTVDSKGRITAITTATTSGGGGAGLTALSPSPAGSYGSSSAVPILTVDQYGRVTNATTAAVSGAGGTSGGATAGALASRPTANSGSLYIATDQPAGLGLYYGAGSAWYQLGLFSGNFTTDASGRTDLSSNVPLLGQANTFGNYLQTIPQAKITSCVQGDGTTPCWGAGSSVSVVQNNGTGAGNASTLNFAAGVSASVNAGVATITNTGVTHINGLAGDVMWLPDFVEDGSYNLAYTSHAGATVFLLSNTNAATGGVHNAGMFAASDGTFNFYDYTANHYSMHFQPDSSFLPNVVTFASLAACTSSNKGALAEVSDSTTNTWGATVTGGGANEVGAHCNGTNWTVYAR